MYRKRANRSSLFEGEEEKGKLRRVREYPLANWENSFASYFPFSALADPVPYFHDTFILREPKFRSSSKILAQNLMCEETQDYYSSSKGRAREIRRGYNRWWWVLIRERIPLLQRWMNAAVRRDSR
jgi:hypothetical protein